MNEPVDHAVRRAAGRLTRAEGVGHARDGKPQAKEAAIELQILLRRRLVNGVQAQRFARLLLRDRQIRHAAVLQPRPDEHQLGCGVHLSHRLEQHEVAAAIHVEIRPGIFHAADRAGLAGEIEDRLLPAHEVGHQLVVADVALDDPDTAALEDGGLIGMALARKRQHRESRAALGKARGQIHADEPQAADDQRRTAHARRASAGAGAAALIGRAPRA